jgi:hypothetical protein
MNEPKFFLINTIKEAKIELSKTKKEWEELKRNNNFQFPEYTDAKIEELEHILSRKPQKSTDESIIQFKSMNILNEVHNAHFKGRVDLSYILNFSTTSDKIIYFIKYHHLLPDDKYWEYLSFAYQNQDYNPVPNEILKTLFSSDKSGKENLMTKEEIIFLDSLPEVFSIYRAMSIEEVNSKKYRFSWTLDKEIAEKFSERNKLLYKTEMVVKEIEIKKKDVIAYLNGRKEKEIIVSI